MQQKIDEFIAKNKNWTEALQMLRDIFNSTDLEASFKWGSPTYTINNKNVAGFNAFKNHFCIWFFQGVFLKDKHQLLITGQEKTKALRQMRFNSIKEIDKKIIKEYLEEAIQNQKSGKVIKTRKTTSFTLSEQLKKVLVSDKNLTDAFKKLSISKQKEYSNYISEAKQEKTKLKRINKITPMILKGIGLHDKYRNC